jgi:hypothetical protein
MMRSPEGVPVVRGPLQVLIDSTGLQVYGAGQCLAAKHGAKVRRKWRKLHLAVYAANGTIVAQTRTDHHSCDPLLDQIDSRIGRVTADGAPTYATIAAHGDGPLQGADRSSVTSPGFAAQQAQAAVDVAALNRMLAVGRPASIRSHVVTIGRVNQRRCSPIDGLWVASGPRTCGNTLDVNG